MGSSAAGGQDMIVTPPAGIDIDIEPIEPIEPIEHRRVSLQVNKP